MGKNKKNKAIIPYRVSLKLSMEGLEGVPEGTTAEMIAGQWMVKAIISFGEASRGFQIQNHLKLKRIRETVDMATKANQDCIILEPDDYKFLKSCYEGAIALPNANEVFVRVYALVQEAQSNHDREMNEPDGDEEEIISSQDVKTEGGEADGSQS